MLTITGEYAPNKLERAIALAGAGLLFSKLIPADIGWVAVGTAVLLYVGRLVYARLRGTS